MIGQYHLFSVNDRANQKTAELCQRNKRVPFFAEARWQKSNELIFMKYVDPNVSTVLKIPRNVSMLGII